MKNCVRLSIKPTLFIIVILFGCVFFTHAHGRNADVDNNVDPYRWMETDGQQTARWLRHQSDQAVKILHTLPWRNALAKRLSILVNTEPTLSDIYDAGDRRLYLRSTTEHPYLRLFVQQKGKPERVVITPPVGYGINFFSPSPDGHYVAF